MDIIEAINDERLFKPLFKDLGTWNAWLVFLRCLFGHPLKVAGDEPLVKQCMGTEYFPNKRFREAYVIAGRRSGKSTIAAVLAVYLSAFRDWREVLAPGEIGHIFVIATDMRQARIIKDRISEYFERIPSFRKLVRKDLAFDIELRNSVTISVKSCNYRSIRGYTLLAAILDEIAFFRSEDSANPDKEILSAIRPALATIDDSLLLGISTAYARSGVLYENFRRYYGKNEGPLVWKAPTSVMNPTIDIDLINRALSEDPEAARAEWLSEFRDDVSGFISAELLDSVTVQGRAEVPKTNGALYYGFIDPSGGRQDSFTLAICHQDRNGTVVLDAIRETKPPFKPEQVVSEYCAVLKKYGVVRVESDRYGGEWATDAFRRNGIRLKASDKSKSEIYLEFLPIISNGNVELLDSKRLRSQLLALERKTRSGGRDSIDHYVGGHDDVANAVCGAAVLANHPPARPRVRSLE